MPNDSEFIIVFGSNQSSLEVVGIGHIVDFNEFRKHADITQKRYVSRRMRENKNPGLYTKPKDWFRFYKDLLTGEYRCFPNEDTKSFAYANHGPKGEMLAVLEEKLNLLNKYVSTYERAMKRLEHLK